MFAIVVRRLAAVVAAFAVVFAPAATDVRSGSASAPVRADLSGAVLAPTFTAGELMVGRSSDDVAEQERTDEVGHWRRDSYELRTPIELPISNVGETFGTTEGRAEAWSQRGPPTG